MRRVVLAGLLVGLAGSVAQAQVTAAEPAEKREPVIIKPEWVRKPSGNDVTRLWPAAAARKGISGKAVLSCTVTASGTVSDCEVVSETPEGYGFGASALMLAGSFQMKPRTVDGTPVGGATVRIPLSFSSGGERFGDSSRGVPALTEPVWVKAPGFADMAAAWPPSAGNATEGNVTLRCRVMTNGGLTDCKPLAQGLAKVGFGEAAMTLVSRFQLMILPQDAFKVKNGLVNVPFHFLNPQTPAGQARKVADPRWIVQVRQDQVLALYPAIAADAGVRSGQGVADCLVAADGKLTDCKVAREKPQALGFGDAAVSIAGVMQMNPWTDAGRPVDGARIRLPINFTQAEEPAPKAKP